MKGTSHVLSGAAVGIALSPLVAGTGWLAVPFACAAAGAATLPDLDSPRSTASLFVPGITTRLSRLLAGASGRLYHATAGPRDEPWTGRHRHMTHTAAFALVAGAATWGLCTVSAWLSLAIYLLLALLTANRLGDWAALVGLGAGWMLIPQVLAAPHSVAWPLAVAVTTGMITHDLGDALTHMGCPIVWPLLIRGETWYEIKLLGPCSFTTNGGVENMLVTPLLVAAVPAAAWFAWIGPAAAPFLGPALPAWAL